MPSTLTLRSTAADDTTLVLTEVPPHAVNAQLTSPGLAVDLVLERRARTSSLPDFLGSLARDWRAWSGVRSWANLEGTLTLDCSNDSRGHIKVLVRLAQLYNLWTATAVLTLDAGQLDPLVHQANGLFPAP